MSAAALSSPSTTSPPAPKPSVPGSALAVKASPASVSKVALGEADLLWSIHAADGRVKIWFGPMVGKETGFFKGPELYGNLLPNGAASGDGQLWLVYDDFSVQSVEARSRILEYGWTFRTRRAGSLPRGVRLLSLAAVNGNLWAMVQAEDAHTLARVEALEQAPLTVGEAEVSPVGRRDPSSSADTPTEASERATDPEAGASNGSDTPRDIAEPAEEQPSTLPSAQQKLPQVALLRLALTGARWQRVPLPETLAPLGSLGDIEAVEVPEGTTRTEQLQAISGFRRAFPWGRFWVLSGGREEGWPTLARDRGPGAALEIWTPPTAAGAASTPRSQPAEAQESGTSPRAPSNDAPPRWTVRRFLIDSYRVHGDRLATLAILDVGSQQVLASGYATQDSVSARFGLLRSDLVPSGVLHDSDENRPWPMGTLEIPDAAAASAWGMIGAGRTAGLMVVEGEDRVRWTTLSLQGVIEPVREIIKERKPILPASARLAVLSLVFLGAVVVVIVATRRKPDEAAPRLPPIWLPAPVFARFLAGSWDLLLAGFITGIITNRPIEMLIESHPAFSDTWNAMAPFGIWMAVYTVIGLLTEGLGFRGLGKSITRLAVVDQFGQPLKRHVAMLRVFTRVLDLIGLFFLLVPLMSVWRQRLCDILINSVVVRANPNPTRHRDDASLRDSESHDR